MCKTCMKYEFNMCETFLTMYEQNLCEICVKHVCEIYVKTVRIIQEATICM
jgi:hypothetical protein